MTSSSETNAPNNSGNLTPPRAASRQTDAETTRAVVTPTSETAEPPSTQQDAPLLPLLEPLTIEEDAGVLVAVFNTSEGTGARTTSQNPGTTQTAQYLFQPVVTLLLMSILDTFGKLPGAWLLTEVAFSLKKGNMSLLSQEAPKASRSGKGVDLNDEAAVVWGPACNNDAESWTLSLRKGKQDGDKYYVKIVGTKGSLLRVTQDGLKEEDKGGYRGMLSRVAAARLTLPVVGGDTREPCIFLSYHGPHKKDPEIKVQYLCWFLQLACSLTALGFHVVAGGDLNINPEEQEDPKLKALLKRLQAVSYEMTARRSHKKKIDWLYLINPDESDLRLECVGECKAIDPAQHYRSTLGEASCIELNPEWFDHDVLLAVLRLAPK